MQSTGNFTNELTRLGCSYRIDDGSVVVTHEGHVYLDSLTSLPEGVRFENKGYVYLRSLTSLPEGVKFENKGHVYLRSLTSLPEGVRFENKGSVDLHSLESSEQTYLGKQVHLECIDGYTMLINGWKRKGEFQVSSARYFGGGPIDKLRKCYVAKQGEYFAHGKTIREAIDDVRFKVMQSTLCKDELVASVKEKGTVTFNEYRLLTGACREGLKAGLVQLGLPEDTTELPLPKVLECCKGMFGERAMRELFV